MLRPSELIPDTSLGRSLIARGRAAGRLEQSRQILLTLGAEKLGAPDLATTDAINEIDDVVVLERPIRRVLTASSWQELLADTDG